MSAIDHHSTLAPMMRPGAPHLRLVRRSSEALGPVSPELVMVSPDLADALRPLPDSLDLGDPTPGEDVPTDAREAPTRGDRDGRFDTRDLLLERHGLSLELRARDGEPWWVLTLPRGETVAAPGAEPPPEITSLLHSLVRDAALVSVPVRSTNPELGRLEQQVSRRRESLLAHEPGVRLATDPENLHQLRVASRRLRSFVRVARGLVGANWARETGDGLRGVVAASGEARDLDVLIEHLRAETAKLDDSEREAAADLLRALVADRERLQTQLIQALDGDEYRALLDRLGLPIEEALPPSPQTLEDLAARELRRLLKSVRRLGKHPRDGELHRLRIRVKRVRYAVELGGLPRGGGSKRVIETATRLQDLLGAHQDTVAAEKILRALAERSAPPVAFVAGRLAEKRRIEHDVLQRRLPAAWAELRRLARQKKR